MVSVAWAASQMGNTTSSRRGDSPGPQVCGMLRTRKALLNAEGAGAIEGVCAAGSERKTLDVAKPARQRLAGVPRGAGSAWFFG